MKKDVFFRLIKYMKKYKLLYAGLIATMLAGITLDLSVAWFLSQITNAAVKFDVDRWPLLVAIGIAIMLGCSLISFFDTYLKQKASVKVRNDIRLDTMDHALRLHQAFSDRIHTGDLLARFTSDNQAVGEAAGNVIMGLIRNPLLATCAFIYLLNIHWPLALITICVGPAMILTGKMFGESMRRKGVRLQETMGRGTSYLQDVLGSGVLYKIFGLEKKISKQYRQFSTEIAEIEQSQGKTQGAAAAMSQGIALVTFMTAILLAGYFVAKGSLEVGAMLAFIQLMNYLVNPFALLPALWSSMQQALAGAERIFQVIDAPKEYAELPAASRAKTAFSELVVSSVGFSYKEGAEEVPALRHIGFRVCAGQTVAVVGGSGGGKSTLFKLLLGLYPPGSGSIRIDGKALGDIGPREYRDYFSLVPQESILFTGTIRDNILDGNPDASEEQIIAAAKQANAYDFIMKLPEGFATEIGERGSRLSGGQKQRIAIARAILRDAPILLLDEATAALDNESERLVQDALSKLMIGKTTLVIAHRLSTVQHADLILVMENGEIVENGTHRSLLAAGGRYQELYQAQMKNEAIAAST